VDGSMEDGMGGLHSNRASLSSSLHLNPLLQSAHGASAVGNLIVGQHSRSNSFQASLLVSPSPAAGGSSHSNSPHTSFATGAHAAALNAGPAASNGLLVPGTGSMTSSSPMSSPSSASASGAVGSGGLPYASAAAPAGDLSLLSSAEKDALAKRFITAAESRLANQILPPMLLHVKKLRSAGGAGGGSNSGGSSVVGGSLFVSEWKQRYVTLLDEALVFRDKKVGEGYKWTKPTQCFSLAVGSPAASVSADEKEHYDTHKKVYKCVLEVDLWMKGGTLAWSRRAVILGLPSLDAARQLADQLNQVIFKNQVAASQVLKAAAAVASAASAAAQMQHHHPSRVGQHGGAVGSVGSVGLMQHGLSHAHSHGQPGNPLQMPLPHQRASTSNHPLWGARDPTPHHYPQASQHRSSLPLPNQQHSQQPTPSSADKHPRKSLRASARQQLHTAALTPLSPSPAQSPLAFPQAPAGLAPHNGSVAPPPTPSSGGTAVLSSPQPGRQGLLYDQTVAAGALSAATTSATPPPRPQVLALPPLNAQSPLPQSSPSGSSGAGAASPPASLTVAGLVSPAGPAGVVSPMYPSTPSPSVANAVTPQQQWQQHGATPVTDAAAADGNITAIINEEEKQIEALFAETMAAVEAATSPAAARALPASVPVPAVEHVRALCNKVKTIVRSSRTRVIAAAAAAGAAAASSSSPMSAAGGAGSSPGVVGSSDGSDTSATAGSDGAAAAAEEDDGPFGFSELLEASDLDDQTRSWLQLTYTNEQREVGASAGEASGAGGAESEAQQHQPASTALDAAETPLAATSTALARVSSSSSLSSLASSVAAPPPSAAAQAAAAMSFGLPLDLTLPPSTAHLGDLSSWDWSVFDLVSAGSSTTDLLPVVYAVFAHFDFLRAYQIDVATFRRWAAQVQKEYFENPFHNFFHAVDVMQTVFSLLTRHGAGVYLTTLEKFSILIAALCHDLRHPGMTNLYLINSRHPLALLYNDQSVLEHHHAASAFRIMDAPERNILAKLSLNEYRAARTRLTLGILATDMTGHFGLLEKFNAFIDEQAKLPANVAQAASVAPTPAHAVVAAAATAADESPQPVPAPSTAPVFQTAHELSDATRAVLFNSILHASDISNPSKPWPVQKQWSDQVLAEFFNQGDLEQLKGLPVSPNCDRATTDQALLSLNFIDFIVAPSYVALRNLLPPLAHACRLIKENRAEWSRRYVTNVTANARGLSEEDQRAELARNARREESFNEIILPAHDIEGGADNQEQSAEDAEAAAVAELAAAADATAGGSSTSLPATPELRALLPSHLSTPSPPHSSNPSRGDPSVSGPGVLTGGFLVRSPLSAGASSSAPSSFSTPSSAHSARRLVAPLSDPRRNSMLLLKQFAASLGPSQQLKLSKHSHTMGPRAGSAAQAAAVAHAKAQQAAQQQAVLQAASITRSPAGAYAASARSPAAPGAPMPMTAQWPGSPAPVRTATAVPAVASGTAPAAAAAASVPPAVPVVGGAVRHFSVTPAGSLSSSRVGSRRTSEQPAADGHSGSALLSQAASQLNKEAAPATSK